jgi:wyosine [tRNA(Phe)-imidazoG37] synthetase (radical SAM superfamily)
MTYVFGPVPSRRLGLSLGVDLIPHKTCTYDCLYCQVGKTTLKTTEVKPHVPLKAVLEELTEQLEKVEPDTITLAGSGEPTLHSQIDRVIDFIKGRTDTKIAVLTNGSLLWNESVRKRLFEAHLIMPTLTTVYSETFKRIHRPHPDLEIHKIIEGIKQMRQAYGGELSLEVVLLQGYNESPKEIEGLKRVIKEIHPDRIQLNTVVRPPSDPKAVSLDRERLEEIKTFFGSGAEIIAHIPLKDIKGKHVALVETVLEMARRRPLRAVDVSKSLDIEMEETEAFLKGLTMKGALQKQDHGGEVFYVIRA